MPEPKESKSVDRPIAGMLFAAAALLAFAIQDTLVKSLSANYPVMQLLTIRTVVVVFLLIAAGLWFYGSWIVKTNNPKPMLIRGVLAFFAFSSYYLSLSQIPLADAAAIYMTAPLFVTLLSIPLLRERVGFHRWAAIVTGFIAVVFMLKPGTGLFQFMAALPLFSAVCYAMIPIINRRIGYSQHVLTMSIYTTSSYLMLALIAAVLIHILPPPGENSPLLVKMLLARWQIPTAIDFAMIAASGVIFVFGLMGITHAYRVAAVSVVAPAEYSYLIWTSVLGIVIFNDFPDFRVVSGSAVVVAAGLYVMYRERKLAEKQ